MTSTKRNMGERSQTLYCDQVVVQLASLRRLYHHVEHGGKWDYVIDKHRLGAAIATIERQHTQISMAHDELMNLQPHIAQLQARDRPFIDSHVDAAMDILSDSKCSQEQINYDKVLLRADGKKHQHLSTSEEDHNDHQ